VEDDAEVSAFHEVVSALWRHMISCAGTDLDARQAVEAMLDDARISVGMASERVQAAARLKVERWAAVVAEVASSLSTSFSLDRIAKTVEEKFPRLGIARLELLLYDREDEPGDEATRILSYGAGKARRVPTRLKRRDYGRFMQPERGNGVIVAPLFFDDKVLGLVGMDLTASGAFAYEAVRESLSAAVKGARLSGAL
jgi:hypothetical protein